MAVPRPIPTDISPAAMARIAEWAKVLDVTVGKDRFKAIRAILREHLRTTGRAPAAAKKFLSERLIRTVGPSGSASKLPRELRRMLGAGADDFAREVQTGYYFLTGKAPKGPTNRAFKNMLSAMQKAGMPASRVAELRKLGPAQLMRQVGAGRGVSAVLSSPVADKVVGWAALSKAGTAIPVPLEEVTRAVATPAAAKAAAAGGAKGMAAKGINAAKAATKTGTLGKIVGAITKGGLGKGVIPGLATLYAGYDVLSTGQEKQAEEQRAKEMLATGVIPEGELGGAPIVAGHNTDNPITASQFLAMMGEREDQVKRARFHAASREGDLTREVLSYITGGEDTNPRQVQRMKLGAARTPQSKTQPKPDEVMKQFDLFLRQATSGGG